MTRRDLDDRLLPALDGEPGPARRLPASRAAELVDAALAATAGQVPAPPEPRAAERRPRRSGWMRVAVAAALLVVAGGASAAVYVVAVRAPKEATAPAPPPSPAPRRHAVAPSPPPPEVAPAPEPDIEMAPDVVAPKHRAHPRVDEGPADAPPEDLLALANQRRRDKRWRDADAVYRRVIREHAGTRAAYVATLASASIQLDHLARPRAALRLYRRALASEPKGALAEEARWGIAEAQRALADEEGEVAALRDFLAHHPHAPQAARAHQRLEVLGAGDD